MILAGFLVSLDNVLPIVWPFQWISPLKYLYSLQVTVITIALSNIRMNLLNNPNNPNYGSCVSKWNSNWSKGNDFRELLSVAGVDLSIGTCFYCLAILYVVFILLGFAGLKYSSKRV